jgi:hypothetical protein
MVLLDLQMPGMNGIQTAYEIAGANCLEELHAVALDVIGKQHGRDCGSPNITAPRAARPNSTDKSTSARSSYRKLRR